MIKYVVVRDFLPIRFKSGCKGNTYPMKFSGEKDSIEVYYYTDVSNHTGSKVGRKRMSFVFPKKIKLNENTMEVLGLLQGEMSKTHRGPITFANYDANVMRKVINWFSSDLNINMNSWHWYVKINLNEPLDEELKNQLEKELVEFWLNEVPINYEFRYPKTIVYMKRTKNFIPKNEGTLTIERRGPIFVQFIQKFVEDIFQNILSMSDKQIRAFIRGVIAAEGTINFEINSHHRRVFISAKKQEERDLIRKCLGKLGIECYDCKSIFTLVISRYPNLVKLDKQGLIGIQHDKTVRFKEMMSSFVNKNL